MNYTIYSITNTLTGDCYIGSTTNYKKRKQRHMTDLKNKNHHSIILQRATDKYGLDAFKFSVLKNGNCDKIKLSKLESNYIKKYNPKYNVNMNAQHTQLDTKRNKEFKEQCSKRMLGRIPWNKGIKTGKQSETHIKNRIESMKGHIISKETRNKIRDRVSRPVTQYDKHNNFIKAWKSPKEAASILHISYTGLIRYLNGNSNINTYKGYIWKREQQTH